jgi:hypothetical protein
MPESRGASRANGRGTGRAARRATSRALRSACTALALAASLALAAEPARAEWKGNLGLGYSKLFISEAPAGGFALALGVNQEAGKHLRVGPVVAYHLLGTQSVNRGSENANVDYSMFELELRADWRPWHTGSRISFGPSLTRALADISSSSAGLAFEDLAVSEWKGGLGLDAAWLPSGERPVAVGVEAGVHVSFVSKETWSVGTIRLVLEY